MYAHNIPFGGALWKIEYKAGWASGLAQPDSQSWKELTVSKPIRL